MFGLSKAERLAKKLKEKQLEIVYKEKEIVYELLAEATTFQSDESEWNLLKQEKEAYSEAELTALRIQADNLYRQRPLAKGLIRGLVNYVIGKNGKEDPDTQLEKAIEYWDDWRKNNSWKKRKEEIVDRTLRQGEIFVRKFKTLDGIKFRFIEPEQIKDTSNSIEHSYGIETKEGDVETPVKYYRTYYDSNNTEHKEVIPADQMIHRKIGTDSNVKRGLSFFVGIARYIVDYDNWLNDRIKLNKVRSFFAVIGKSTGATAASTLAEEFTSATKDSGQVTEDSPSKKKKGFKSGSILLNKGIEWDLKNLNINASDTKEDGRAILLQIAAGTNLAEFMVTGDASNANYSSTMVAESPAVKAIEHWQEFFGEIFLTMFEEVMKDAIARGKVPSRYAKETTGPEGKVTKEIVDTETTATPVFPIVLHRNLLDETKAMSIHQDKGWASPRTCSTKAGYDYDHEKEELETVDEELYKKERDREFAPLPKEENEE